MDVLRVYLLAGLVLHKLLWEALKRGGPPRVKAPFRAIKGVKMAALGCFLAQTFLPPVLPMGASPELARAAGLALFTAGLAVAMAARVQLGRNWSDVESATVLPGQTLVASGLYRHIRHPIYTGDLLLVAGLELALGSWLVLLALPLAVFIWKKSAGEERLLSGSLPGYREYLETSGRFLPRHVAVGVAGLAMALGAQMLLVYGLYGGNWTALFMQGSRFKPPPVVAAEKPYVFEGSAGYDGQFYHWMAHDPWMTRDAKRFMDDPKLRYPRILMPGLAWLAAFGEDRWIDAAFLLVALVPFFLGPWWLARLLAAEGRSRWWGLGFLVIPSAIISIDRLCVDAWLLALCCGFLVFAREDRGWQRLAVLTLAPLARETGFLVIGACGLWLLLRKRIVLAMVTGVAFLPAALWTLHARAGTRAAQTHIALPESGSALLDRFFEFPVYNLPPAIRTAAIVLDYVSLCGVVLALILAFVYVIRSPRDPARMLALPFAALPLVLGGVIGWYEPFGFPRTLSPLYLALGVTALTTRSWIGLLPLGLALPRIVFQLAPHVPFVRQLAG